MNFNEIKVNLAETFGEIMVVSNGREVYLYIDGKKTEKVDGIAYKAISTKNWNTFNIKVTGRHTPINYTGAPIPVKLIGAETKLWFDYKANEPKISISTESIEPISTGQNQNGKRRNLIYEKNHASCKAKLICVAKICRITLLFNFHCIYLYLCKK